MPVLFDYITNARGTVAARAQTFSIVLRQQPYPTRLGGRPWRIGRSATGALIVTFWPRQSVFLGPR
ncbi:hypothetical protein I553_8192 [Mycobacterium xenopi 4042]|uniref:Uncharacterized protein n=1 Tax=Mycobacterium xenopi 4042 TaxID=1299334 RepID=X8DC78_MYCXE|nr:hypothetical protein I553_8192 [Mycobacterium xenopi 4042]